jgi:hypothetical protein
MSSNKEVPMHRLAARLLCAFVAGSVLAEGVAVGVAGVLVGAPAPFPRPGPPGPWFDGWERPLGDGHFERRGDRLTITVPGKSHELDVVEGRLNAPRLLRDVEGDFAVQVRVGGNFRDGQGAAGLILLGGGKGVSLALGARRRYGKPQPYCWTHFFDRSSNVATTFDGHVQLPGETAWLRLERRGHTFITQGDLLDGHGWMTWEETEGGVRLPKKVKVGVFAEATASGTYKAVFDQFRLTPLTGPARQAAR